MNSKIKVIKESESGRNEKFYDKSQDKEMTRSQFVKEIEKGNYEDYHIRVINKVKTPVSNPDGNSKNNLG